MRCIINYIQKYFSCFFLSCRVSSASCFRLIKIQLEESSCIYSSKSLNLQRKKDYCNKTFIRLQIAIKPLFIYKYIFFYLKSFSFQLIINSSNDIMCVIILQYNQPYHNFDFRKLLIRQIEENWSNICVYIARLSLLYYSFFFFTLKFAYQDNRRARFSRSIDRGANGDKFTRTH